MLESIFLGITSSFTAALAFLIFAFFFLRPKIGISENIAKSKNDSGKDVFTFKIINLTPYPVIDIRIEISISTPRNIVNGQINDKRIITTHEAFQLDSINKLNEPHGNEEYFAIAGLEEIWNDNNQYVMLKVLAKHSLSQFSQVFSKNYYRKGSSIVLGYFEHGENLKVVPNS